MKQLRPESYGMALPMLGMIHHPKYKITRDFAMFVLGGAAFTYETLSGTDRPNVLYGALALMGVAAYLRGMSEMDKKK